MKQKMNQAGSRSEKNSTFFGGSNFTRLNNYEKWKMKKISSVFTLVELLVVITVLAILASMLLPTLDKAGDKAKEISCVSQQKSLASMFIQYCNNYDDYMPLVQYAIGSQPVTLPMALMSMNWNLSIYNCSATYYANPKDYPFDCPLEPICWKDKASTMSPYFGNYAWNYTFLGYTGMSGASSDDYRKITISTIPSRTMIGVDGCTTNPSSGPILYNWNFMSDSEDNLTYGSVHYRHNGHKAGAFFADGHGGEVVTDAGGIYPDIAKVGGVYWQ